MQLNAKISNFLGLRRNTRYWVKVQVRNNVGVSPLSKKYTFATPRRERMGE